MDPCSRPTKSCHGASNRAAILGFLQIQFEANVQQEVFNIYCYLYIALSACLVDIFEAYSLI